MSTRREFIALLGGYRKAAFHTTNQLILSESPKQLRASA